jgi:hypothetical protein
MPLALPAMESIGLAAQFLTAPWEVVALGKPSTNARRLYYAPIIYHLPASGNLAVQENYLFGTNLESGISLVGRGAASRSGCAARHRTGGACCCRTVLLAETCT